MTPERYLLDTTSVVDVSMSIEPVRRRVRNAVAAGVTVGICAITVGEFMTGIAPSKRPDWIRFFSSFAYWDISLDAAIQAGTWRYDYARRGIALSMTDVLIAAVAVEVNAVVVTDNARHFPMPNVRIESFR